MQFPLREDRLAPYIRMFSIRAPRRTCANALQQCWQSSYTVGGLPMWLPNPMATFCGEIRKDRMVCSILFHHSYTESARANSALRAIPIGATLLSATMKIFLIRHMHMYDSEFNGAPHCAQAMGPSARCRACFPGLSRVSLGFPRPFFCFWCRALFLVGPRIFCFPVSGTAIHTKVREAVNGTGGDKGTDAISEAFFGMDIT